MVIAVLPAAVVLVIDVLPAAAVLVIDVVSAVGRYDEARLNGKFSTSIDKGAYLSAERKMIIKPKWYSVW